VQSITFALVAHPDFVAYGRFVIDPRPPAKPSTPQSPARPTPGSSAGVGAPEPSLVLRKSRDRAIQRHHPWVFSGAVDRVQGSPAPGDTVVVRDHEGDILGRAAYSPTSQIVARLFTFDEKTRVDAALIHARVRAAVAMRRRLVLDPREATRTDCARLVFAESDGLPGVVVDAYGDVVVLQCQSAGAERWKNEIVQALADELKPRAIVERSDAEVRRLEGLSPRAGVISGAVDGPVRVHENGLTFLVDVLHGHKTGFYLDQRQSRARLRAMVRDRSVLNCFSYTGAFSIAALAGGATHVTSVDSSLPALELAEKHVAENGFDAADHDGLKGDVFEVLRAFEQEGKRFDCIVLDPPKLAPKAEHVDKAARAYKDLALFGFRLLSPGGLLFVFSCSGAIDRSLFSDIVARASLEAHRPAQVVEHLGQAVDHPVLTSFPEGEYLKGLVCVAP
jgi:23S rRNA (cytosine1962-C5)-methyltransferase